MQLEEGKFYRTRGGEHVGPLSDRGDDGAFTWLAPDRADGWDRWGNYLYRALGASLDLVAEWVDEPTANDPIALTSERKNQHGDWLEQSYLANGLKGLAHVAPGWSRLSSHQQEALDMILTKVSRVVSGDPNHEDHWNDIAGYAYLGKGGHKP